jgi:hypothetical protein
MRSCTLLDVCIAPPVIIYMVQYTHMVQDKCECNFRVDSAMRATITHLLTSTQFLTFTQFYSVSVKYVLQFDTSTPNCFPPGLCYR